MISSPVDAPRHMLPRWRSLDRTLASKELSAAYTVDAGRQEFGSTQELDFRVSEWHRLPSLVTASELMEASIVYGHEEIGIEAAREIAGAESHATALVKSNARALLQRAEKTVYSTHIPRTTTTWRSHLRLYPEDALAWVELSLAQVSVSASNAALRSMSVALKLSPINRHVLRSAARLFIHLHEPDRAHDLLRKAEVTPNDPWLMAAEISTAVQAERRPNFLKRGLDVVSDGRRAPRQVTELAGALGTCLLSDGDRKKGKRFIRQSLNEPTGNSLAQAEWVAHQYGEQFMQIQQLRSEADASEALTARYFQTGDFKLSAFFANEWVTEEPFSTRAYGAASVASATIEDYRRAESYARGGLKRDPSSTSLLNSHVFALAELGRLDEAEEQLSALTRRESNLDNQVAVAEANRGLLALKRGQEELAIYHYMSAIATFVRLGQREVENLARAYFARGAVRARFKSAPAILAEARDRGKEMSTAHSRYVLEAAISLSESR